MAFSDQSGDPAQQQPQDKGAQGNNQQQQQAPSGQQVFMVVGDRAYRTQDDVINKLQHADQHIATLESERDTDRQKLKAQETEIESLKAEVERLKKIVDALPGQDANADPSGKGQQTAAPSKEELVKDVMAAMHAETDAAQRKANHAACITKVAAKFGQENVDSKVEEIAKDLGMTVAQAQQLAMNSPKGFEKLFLGEVSQPTPGASHDGGINSNAFQQQNQQNQKPVNITKLRERDRIAHVSERMKAAGIVYANK